MQLLGDTGLVRISLEEQRDLKKALRPFGYHSRLSKRQDKPLVDIYDPDGRCVTDLEQKGSYVIEVSALRHLPQCDELVAEYDRLVGARKPYKCNLCHSEVLSCETPLDWRNGICPSCFATYRLKDGREAVPASAPIDVSHKHRYRKSGRKPMHHPETNED